MVMLIDSSQHLNQVMAIIKRYHNFQQPFLLGQFLYLKFKSAGINLMISRFNLFNSIGFIVCFKLLKIYLKKPIYLLIFQLIDCIC